MAARPFLSHQDPSRRSTRLMERRPSAPNDSGLPASRMAVEETRRSFDDARAVTPTAHNKSRGSDTNPDPLLRRSTRLHGSSFVAGASSSSSTSARASTRPARPAAAGPVPAWDAVPPGAGGATPAASGGRTSELRPAFTMARLGQSQQLTADTTRSAASAPHRESAYPLRYTPDAEPPSARPSAQPSPWSRAPSSATSSFGRTRCRRRAWAWARHSSS